MPGKYEAEVAALLEQGTEFWWPFFHRQYMGSAEGRIRRAYMDLAKPPFYPRVFEAADIKPDETVLDIGCGDGTDIICLHERGHRGRVVGMETPVPENAEITDNKINHIELKLQEAGVENYELKTGYAEELDFENEFDVIWAANVLQECFDIDRALDKIFRALKPGGKLIATTNHIDNKPIHHSILAQKAPKIGGVAPKPLSSRFNSVTGPIIMARHRHQFRLTHSVIQQGERNLRLTEEELPVLLASLSTYWNDIMPAGMSEGAHISRDELVDFTYLKMTQRGEILKEVEEEMLAAINASPDKAVYETIKRVAYIYKKRSKPAHFIMRSAATIKERSL